MTSLPQMRIDELNTSLFMLGVTGSMGCGKSYACNELGKQAAHVGVSFNHLEIDLMRRDMLGINPYYASFRTELAASISGSQPSQSPPTHQSVLDDDGSISTARFNSIIYSSDAAMASFRQLLIPCLVDCIHDKLQGKTGIAAIDWALLAEDGMLPLVRYNTLLVSCDKDIQLTRLRGNDLSEQELERRISLQLTNREKKLHIRSAQKQAGRGNLYTFDTSKDPASEEYQSLFSQIALTIDMDNQDR